MATRRSLNKLKRHGMAVFFLVGAFTAQGFLCFGPVFGAQAPSLSAKSALIMDAVSGRVLYSKNPHLRLPPASCTKLMTALVAMETLAWDQPIRVTRNAVETAPSKAGLTYRAFYRTEDLVTALLVSSSNDAAVALAEGAAGTQERFVRRMNQKAKSLGLANTTFVNCTGLTDPNRRRQYSTAYDLARLMRLASKDSRIDRILGMTTAMIRGSDGQAIALRSHNKMLWRTPKYVKGKTGWTFASLHTFVGMDYSAKKRITFAMLRSQKPWTDIERLADFGLLLKQRGWR